MSEIPTLFPPGHFYSPICDPAELRRREQAIWPPGITPAHSPAIRYNVPRQLELLDHFAEYVRHIDFPVQPSADPAQYHYNNDQYPYLDAVVLFCFLLRLKPKRVVEVGSGFSSLILAEVNRRFLSSAVSIVLVEPYPRQFLIDGVRGISQLIRQPVQDVGPELFDTLRDGDILFIDSSHVSKTGSDVNYLIFEILPRLDPGVYVHIHDIFLPDDYPKRWAIEEGRNWNEQYTVRAFLQYNYAFEIEWLSYLMCTRYPEQTRAVFKGFPTLGSGGSLWLRRTAARGPNE